MTDIRKLKAKEIECRAQIVKQNGCSLLLYKDARCDMKILDETFGAMNWEREHHIINGNLFCKVKIWDKEKEQWIIKEDVGVESRTEKEKGQASDAFKRACFNVGIGRELYSAPFIWVQLNNSETYQKNDSWRLKPQVDFQVSKIDYDEDGNIIDLQIKDQNGNVRYKMDGYAGKPEESKEKEIYCSADGCNKKISQKVANYCKNNPDKFDGRIFCKEHQKKYLEYKKQGE